MKRLIMLSASAAFALAFTLVSCNSPTPVNQKWPAGNAPILYTNGTPVVIEVIR